KKHFQNLISTLKDEGRYRSFLPIRRQSGVLPLAYNAVTQRDVTVWCSNDYLGMSRHKVVTDAMKQAIDTCSAGAGCTRNIAGTSTYIVELEETLADLHKKDTALVFSSGYVANQTALATLAELMPGVIIFSDAHNHASMIQGLRLGRCEKRDRKSVV